MKANRSIYRYWTLTVSLLLAVLAAGCQGNPGVKASLPQQPAVPENHPASRDASLDTSASAGTGARFTLKTAILDGKMVFVGVGGDLDGITNPELHVQPGETVQITLINGDGALHDITLPDFQAASDQVTGRESSTQIAFTAGEAGVFPYFCSVPGHRQAGMEGKLVVGAGAPAALEAPSVVRPATDLPAPVGSRPAQTVHIDLETVEVVGQLADGTSYTYWTFNGKIPGPFWRVRVGDHVEVTLKNALASGQNHSVDFHAVTGPGGGAAVTQTGPGQETRFSFQPLNPGLYVYHCATPSVAHHIANGMYGMILVEPESGLPPVDREFYVMQGEIYTQGPYGAAGAQEFSQEKMLAEAPEYFVFNGAVGGLTAQHPMQASVGETVRIFFGVGGPNAVSSFHVIGEIFDRVYDQASLTSAPLTDVQTTLVPAGGAAMVEFGLDVPGRFILVDHALSRLERGLAGYLLVDGPENHQVFEGTVQENSGH
jgi:nitrite reductase (NO-forming)